jgi:UDP-N-acetylglucosamine/UDP-N-acetylgalactosamine diphosphorylase
MITIPSDLLKRLRKHGQEHVLAWWAQLDEDQGRKLLAQLRATDFDLLKRLYAERARTFAVPTRDRISPVPVDRLDPADRTTTERGEQALRRGEVAVLVVAGGQGIRLGCDHPKGMFPIGPVTNKPRFQIHAEKVCALARRYGKPIPFLVMTSPATHEETEAFFKQHNYFGLPSADVFFFCQGTMPALDMATGRVLMEERGRLFASPNGHGGTLTALADSGLLDRLDQRGIRQIYYFQVDNPLARVADPQFLGHHLAIDAEVSCKIIPKDGPQDKLGNLALIDGRLGIIEYSDLPEELARATGANGHLWLWAGSPAIHYFSVDFLKRVTQGALRIPYHVARKKVPYLDEFGQVVQPAKENALKFEMFIFDVLPLAERWTVVETNRREEFMPLKNATGPDSPETVRQALSNLAGDWLENSGVAVPKRDNGDVAFPLEISPCFALDAQELARMDSPDFEIRGPLYLGDDRPGM